MKLINLVLCLIQLKERGPYAYRHTTQKIDVNFKDNKRSSKTWTKEAKFDKAESCEDCKENDTVLSISLWYRIYQDTSPLALGNHR